MRNELPNAIGPTFSIIITCYNQGSYIAPCVTSALSQSHRPKEIIVVDDGSTDGSLEILERFREQVRLFALPSNRGAIAARNAGASEATGDYLVFLDGDDLLMPWALQVYSILTTSGKQKVLLGKPTWFRGETPSLSNLPNPTNIEYVDYDALLRKDRGVGLFASTYVVDRREFERAGGWSAGIFQLDLQDLSTKLGLSPMTIIFSPATAFYRIHDGNTIHTVPPFLTNLHRLLAKERAGEYPGGRAWWFERRTWFGGLIIFWIRRSLRAGLYVGALKLVLSGWAMVLLAILRRTKVVITGRKAVQEQSIRVAANTDAADGSPNG